MTPAEILEIVLKATLFPGLTFLVGLSLVLEWYERKIEARLQNRMGPAYTGPWGVLQPLADVLKLLGKEDLMPRGGDRLVAGAGLVWSISLAAFAGLFLPWTGKPLLCFEGDVFLVIGLLGLSSALLALSAASTLGPYSVIGSLRLLGLMVSYDVALASIMGIPYAVTGSLSVYGISRGLWSGLAEKPYLIPIWLLGLPLGLILVAAEAGKDPFTIAEAETEVAGGYLAEMSGRRLAFACLVHDLHFLVSVFLYASVFLGFGGHLSLPVYLAAGFATAFPVILVDASMPRLRLGDIGRLSWSILVPSSLLLSATAMILGVAAP